ncbi:efflux RND transporter periplasmic adaptor subunit [Undibacterium sp. Ren11W]|uniref:efflux RND transporter periplasmic adaptor subunit n=1 Tax=Undibacterium sp. Ren11W TaxID=3413045 RepID=UPI003BF3C6B5
MTTPIIPAANKTGTDATALLAQLADTAKARWWKRPVLWIGIAALLLSALGAYLWQQQRIANAAPSFTTEAVSKGDLTLTVTANGTLQPTRSVNIGSELSGTVARVLVDVNDVIKKGQILVELDTAKLNDQVVRSRAALASAEAAVALAVATVKETRSNLARLEEVSRLSGGKVPSGTELDTGKATLERAVANELSARANVLSAKATLSTDVTNLSKASIRAPSDGVILTRTVDPGNAVAASLQAVTLFTIAEDLRKLRLQVNVDEADVGSVKIGQKARFTVSAYANRKYPAAITRVAFGSTITENVVTYLTYLDVDNTDLSLRPGMTATANIVADERHDVLLVPNTALRFSPSQTARATANKGIVASLMPRGPARAPRKSAASAASVAAVRQVWVLRDGTPVAVSVTPGISNGKMTEITAGDLQLGMQVITDQHSTSAP